MCSMPYSPPASKELVTGSCLATECQKLGSLGWEAATTLSISEVRGAMSCASCKGCAV